MVAIIIGCLVVQFAFYWGLFSKLVFYSKKTTSGKKSKISVVICYKNESENIDSTLPKIIKQDFDELVLVDDNSEDDTFQKLQFFATEKIKVISTSTSSSGKKKALLEGINAAKYNAILLTDADCSPESEAWVEKMREVDASFVLGYGPMVKEKGGIITFARFETYMTALQYLSYALAGVPYMAVGRNLKIDKHLFLDRKESIKGQHLASGDDDLMINQLATKDNTSICLDPTTFMYSKAKPSLASYLKQKTRHVSTSPYYKLKHKILLSLFSGTTLLFFLMLIFGTLTGTISLKLGLLFLLVKWCIQQSINFFVMQKLREEDLFWKFPILDLLFFVYLLILPFYFLVNKNESNWN